MYVAALGMVVGIVVLFLLVAHDFLNFRTSVTYFLIVDCPLDFRRNCANVLTSWPLLIVVEHVKLNVLE